MENKISDALAENNSLRKILLERDREIESLQKELSLFEEKTKAGIQENFRLRQQTIEQDNLLEEIRLKRANISYLDFDMLVAQLDVAKQDIKLKDA